MDACSEGTMNSNFKWEYEVNKEVDQEKEIILLGWIRLESITS